VVTERGETIKLGGLTIEQGGLDVQSDGATITSTGDSTDVMVVQASSSSFSQNVLEVSSGLLSRVPSPDF
jgi:hypothetical protein